jgi:hypothetical protein
MSNELLNVLLQFGPAAVLLIAAGAIVAAVIGAANAWAVAWFSARATRQLAIDAAHRDYRKRYCAPVVRAARLLDGVALHITDSLGQSLDAGFPLNHDEARELTRYARDRFATIRYPEFRVPLPGDELFKEAVLQAAKAEHRLRAAVRDLDAAIPQEPIADLSTYRRELVTAAVRVGRAMSVLQLATECFIFDLRGSNRRRLSQVLVEEKH